MNSINVHASSLSSSASSPLSSPGGLDLHSSSSPITSSPSASYGSSTSDAPPSPNTIRTFLTSASDLRGSTLAASSDQGHRSFTPSPSEHPERQLGIEPPEQMARQSTATPTLPASPASSPGEKTRSGGLTFPGVARLLVRIRRARHRSSASASARGVITSSSSPTGALMTHGTLQQPAANVASTSAVPSNNERKVPLVTNATFVCAGGVDAQKLLRATRETLLARAQKIGGNVLVDERWTCTITPRNKGDGVWRTHIEYEAAATRSDQPDPHKPVALDQARSVPGLMTVLDRA